MELSMPKLGVIIASTRPGRKGGAIGEWFVQHARSHGAFDVETLDLARINLPFLDEPNHPRARDYQHDHTRAWSAQVDECDAFVFVTPEYNFAMPATLKNAIDFLFVEWSHKPCSFVSYGGVSAGLRSVQMTKQVVTSVNMYPIAEAVSIPFVNTHFSDEDFAANDVIERSATTMLDELMRASDALATRR
jgi:NAD(P)H-dependent FMN reductase